MPRVVLAPDKFKGTLTAAEVAQHLADGIRSRRPDIELVTVPVADGGDGMLDAFETAGFHRVPVDAADAIGVVRPSRFVRRGRDAVIELAAVAGLARLGESRVPLTATSWAASRSLGTLSILVTTATNVVLGAMDRI